MDIVSPVAQDVQPPPTCDSHVYQKAKEGPIFPEQHAKFFNVREPILRDIDMSLGAILDLKTSLNTLTAIGRLPEELLAEILVTFVHEHYFSESARRDYACFYRHPPPRWIKVTHVCRHWRDIALHTPRLWGYLYVIRPDAFALFLKRSKAAPLHIDVRFDALRASRKGSSLDLIPLPSSRIRSLSVDDEIPTVQAFCKRLAEPMEQLETLVLASRIPWFGLHPPPPAVPFVATRGLTPRLCHLELVGLPFRWTDPVFCSSLTTLKVASPERKPYLFYTGPPDIGGTTDLLDVLEQIAPRLEVLDLSGALPTPKTQELGLHPPSRSLSFPSLRSLRLVGPTCDCADLLSHLSSINQTASVHLSGQESRGVQDLIGSLSSHLSARPPLIAVRLGSPYGGFDIDIYGWQTTDMSGNAPIRLTFCGWHGTGENSKEVMRIFLREIRPLFYHLESLNVANGIPYTLKWRDLFSLTPRLRTLVFDGHPFNLFDALLDIRDRPSGGRRLVPLPELRAVHFDDIPFRYPGDNMEREFIDGLISWTTLRRELGMPIETLELRNCQHAEKKDIQELRWIVPNLVCHDEWAQ